ncbi:MAG: CocE/NonD family hydrolase, partial [Vulcanococcus sp.]
MADGVRRRSRIWTPTGDGPWPVLLMRQPYGRAIGSTVTYAHPCWYAGHGYAVVVQDVRGRGDSEGSFGGFPQEAADASSTLAWLRRQPWCNGLGGGVGHALGVEVLEFGADGAGQLWVALHRIQQRGIGQGRGRSQGGQQGQPCGQRDRVSDRLRGGPQRPAVGAWHLAHGSISELRPAAARGWGSVRRATGAGLGPLDPAAHRGGIHPRRRHAQQGA